MNFPGSDAQFHAEQLADFARDKRVVHAHGAGLGAATAKGTAVGRFEQPENRSGVEFYLFALQLR